MSIKSLSPYVLFNGKAAKALALYESVFGVKATDVKTLADIGAPTTPETKDRLIHARLKVGSATLMMGDTQVGTEAPASGHQHVCLDFADVSDMQKKYDALLAGGGHAEMPIGDMPWGGKFGALTDAYGTAWMFSSDAK